MLENGEFSYNLVKRWGKKVQGGNIFNMRKVFMPVNIPGGPDKKGKHWCLCVADIQKKVDLFPLYSCLLLCVYYIEFFKTG
jgi:Ulp1 family protease